MFKCPWGKNFHLAKLLIVQFHYCNKHDFKNVYSKRVCCPLMGWRIIYYLTRMRLFVAIFTFTRIIIYIVEDNVVCTDALWHFVGITGNGRSWPCRGLCWTHISPNFSHRQHIFLIFKLSLRDDTTLLTQNLHLWCNDYPLPLAFSPPFGCALLRNIM
jgi:hypothetical protein